MPKTLVLEHPGFVLLPRKTTKDKKYSINLNVYRNLHPMVNNQCKKVAKENVAKYLEYTGQDTIKFTKPVDVTFQFTKPTRRKMDKGNVFSVAQKYLYDALVSLGVLEDDNDDYIHYEVLEPTKYEKGVSNIRMVFTETTE